MDAANQTLPPPMRAVKALLFDVFGTTVDWRSTVTRALSEQSRRTLEAAERGQLPDVPPSAKQKASSMTADDWGQFAANWRAEYYRFTGQVAEATAKHGAAAGRYKTIDEHHLDSLVEELDRWGLGGFWDAGTTHEMSLIWHRLDPWPDSAEGVRALNAQGLQTCTLSNGSLELLTDMARHARLEWAHVFSAAMFESYKPDPKVYLGAVAKLGLQPHECCMVAAHLNDLEAARELGLRTLYVERDQEEAWPPERAAACKQWVDVWVGVEDEGFLEAARRLRQGDI